MLVWVTRQIEHNMTASALRMLIENETPLKRFSGRILTLMIFSDNSFKTQVGWMTCLEEFLHKCIKWTCKEPIEEIGDLRGPTLLVITSLVMVVHVHSQWEATALTSFLLLHLGVPRDKGVPSNNSRVNMLKRRDGSLRDSRREIRDQSFNLLTLMTSSVTSRKSIDYIFNIL